MQEPCESSLFRRTCRQGTVGNYLNSSARHQSNLAICKYFDKTCPANFQSGLTFVRHTQKIIIVPDEVTWHAK